MINTNVTHLKPFNVATKQGILLVFIKKLFNLKGLVMQADIYLAIGIPIAFFTFLIVLALIDKKNHEKEKNEH